MNYGCVLDDNLLKEFIAFKSGQDCKGNVVEQLLRLYHPPYLTCNRQLEACGVVGEAINQQLIQSGYVNQTLEELSQETLYKVVLTEQASDPSKGYFNIADGSSNKLGKYYSLTAKPTEPREHIKDYLKNLLKNAREVVICDRYFDGTPQQTGRNCMTKGSEKVFTLFPSHLVNVFFKIDQTPTVAQTTKISDACVNHLQATYPNIAICSSIGNNYDDHHDRYLLINNKIEVIITSGIDYLFDPHLTKECTIIVRQV